MKVLITGAAGFIGFHTAKRLLERGDEVVCVDNFNDYYDPALKSSRAKELMKFEVEVIKADVTEYSNMAEIFAKHQIDKVFHSAAQAGVRYSIENPFAYELTNVLGTLNMLELCKNYGVTDFVLSSSSSVYGNNEKLPFSEDDRVDTPISIYAATKKSNEEMCYTYSHLYEMNCTCLRFFTVYGPWGRPDMALFKFTKSILEGEAIEVYNHGDMARDFTYVEDIVDGVVAALDNPFRYEIFNLARGNSVKLVEFIEAVESALEIKSEKNMMPLQPGDVPETAADITKAKEKLGYNPKFSVQEGVRNFVGWYREYYGV